jgi:SpoVK/Ycf46/Vps4 family AAA+-type ATPase
MDPQRDEKVKAQQRRRQIIARLRRSHREIPETLQFDAYEDLIACELVCPDEISVTFDDIGGLEEQKRGLCEAVIFPLSRPDLYRGRLLAQPKGILLYGPPGTGKTMLAMAIARESGAHFINLRMSTLQNKWFGESQKLVRATFSLARKLQPCIVFIDEIDSFLRERSSGDHEVTSNMKSEFLSLWETYGREDSRVIVMGATNRPQDIDEAILRRMPRQFHVALPNVAQRKHILSLALEDATLDVSLSLDEIAAMTDGYSGSDLSELCRQAALYPVREFMYREQAGLVRSSSSESVIMNEQPRGLMRRDFEEAAKTIHPTIDAQRSMETAMYSDLQRHRQNSGPSSNAGGRAAGAGAGTGAAAGAVDPQQMMQLLQLMAMFSQQQPRRS